MIIKCPNCGDKLQVQPAAGLEEKTATCPKCKGKFPIKEFLPQLSFRVDDRNYQLHFGRQWVGRQKEGSDVEVQIPDEQRYMSKQHAIVELYCTAAGIECTFEEHGKNPSKKDGIELVKDDIIYLRTNDCLRLGSKSMYLADVFGDTNQ